MPVSKSPIATSEGTPRELGYRMPAEWEPHAATWLAFPHHATDWLGKPEIIPWVFAEIARVISQTERVRMLVQDRAELRRAARVFARAGVSLAAVDFFVAPSNRSWTRDYLPLFVVAPPARGGKRGRLQLGAVKWRFNGWARYADHTRDEAAGTAVARALAKNVWHPEARAPGKRSAARTSVSVKRRRIVLEGGGIDVDGEGTLLADHGCMLGGAHARNPQLGVADLEQAFRDYLGVTKTIWFDGGITGDDTSGHVDDFCRFVAPGCVVLCREQAQRDPNARALARARERLRGARDAQGRRIQVVDLPMPAPVTYAGLRLPASYANFYIANERVLVPTFNDPADGKALGILSELFPKRSVVGIHMRDFVLGQGTIHCTTQQEPLAQGLPVRFLGAGKAEARFEKPPPGFD